MSAGAVCLALVLSGCSGDAADSAPDPSTTLPERTGPAVTVDACTLVGKRDVEQATGRDLRVVGRRVEDPTLPTETCLWGSEFSVGVLEVRVTPGPVAENTFEAAFGSTAGGEPTRVDDVGEAAYSRTGLTDRTLQVLAQDVVLTLEAKDDPGDPLPEDALTRIARAAVDALPAHPELAPGRDATVCSRIRRAAVAGVLGGEPELRRSHEGAHGAVMCSWSALPGNLVVTVRTSPTQVTNFRANLSPRLYTDVEGTAVESYSQTDRAGDLLMFVGETLVEVEVLPADGLPAADTPTGKAELRLARAITSVVG